MKLEWVKTAMLVVLVDDFLHHVVLQVLVALHYKVEMSILARFSIILRLLSFWQGLSMLMLW